ncbi:DNA repair protein RecN [Paraconexibacter antarcticus]|uniref:DNA repair protein RecN n=1 Tax=Paraconexibacter antarcticus TaxID=2949664 RepID=A0ABY5DL90_9ACTN|nr:DNA repair protein RecN [Paraconexibacter antarcticus]UTI62573.1 DNA repair protein RecN [Paraconexibacter antarcticus]
MLSQLHVENLLLIERASLDLTPGLNVLTGETGAGKTVLAHALDLLLGGRAKSGIVRPGAAEAYVEGVFELPDGLREALVAADQLAPDADELVLARRVREDGRTRASLNGRSCSVSDLRDVAAGLIAFYGQHEHRRLTLASAQLELLDGACGPGHGEAKARYAALHDEVRALEGSLDGLREAAGARDRELDLLEFELNEIRELAPTEAEEGELRATRDRLRHVETLRSGAWGAAEALTPEEGMGVTGLLAFGGGGLEAAEGVDPSLDALTVRWNALAFEAQDLATELRAYAEGLESSPEELDAVEERLAAYDRLARKHGGSIAAVLAHADTCQARWEELSGAEVALEEAQARLAATVERRAAAAEELRAARVAAAPVLAAAVRERLAKLAMEAAVFEIDVQPKEPGAGGADTVEFLIASNPGVPAGPLRDIASGGELSRVMLALMGVANDGSSATLVFDEVDAGIGGQTARAVGEQLRDLAVGRQVVCITHLPQIASLAARHFSIEKDTSTSPARTTVRTLGAKDLVPELVRMLGAESDDVAARRHAKELLKAA